MMLLVIYSAFSHSLDFGNMNKYEKEILSQRWFPWEPVSNLRYSMGPPEITKDAFLIQSIPRDAVALGEVLLAPQKLQRSWELDTRSQRSKVKGFSSTSIYKEFFMPGIRVGELNMYFPL